MRTRNRIRIRLVSAPGDLLDVFRFRYAIYVEEMNRKQKDADHERKLISDSLDDGAYIFAAYDRGSVVGTVRVNFAASSNLGPYEELYRMSAFGSEHPDSTSMCTRLMIAPPYRKSTLGARLAISCFELGLVHGITRCFVDCNDHVIPFFSGLGFRTYIGKVHHEEYGWVTPMQLDLRDRMHLVGNRSPFLRSVRDYDLAQSSNHLFESMRFNLYRDAPQVCLKRARMEHLTDRQADPGYDSFVQSRPLGVAS